MNKQLKKTISLAAMALGAASMVIALILDFMRSDVSYRGGLLIVGAVLLIAGVYLLPTRKHPLLMYCFYFLSSSHLQ